MATIKQTLNPAQIADAQLQLNSVTPFINCLFMKNLAKPMPRFSAVLLIALFWLLQGCAALEPKVFLHSFGYYEPFWKSHDAILLDYAYGAIKSSVYPSQRERLEREGTGVGIGGNIPMGDFLYAKWKDKNTQQVYEDRVDLRDKISYKMLGGDRDLPGGVYFLIASNKLHIYTTNGEDHKGNWPIFEKFGRSMIKKTRQIYPEKIPASE